MGKYGTAVLVGLLSLGIVTTVYALIERQVYQPFFIVLPGGGSQRTTTLFPTGYGWVPNSRIEIFLFAEPTRTADGEVYAAQPRLISTLSANSDGTFANEPVIAATTIPYTFPRLCGTTPAWANPTFMARDNRRKLLRFSSAAPHYWFTGQPCT